MDSKEHKNRKLSNYIRERKYDAFLISEAGLCWNKLKSEDQWYKKIHIEFKASKGILSYNTTELKMMNEN